MSTDAAATTKAATGGIWEDSAVVDLVERAPPDWQVLRLQDVCTRITDGTHKTPRYQPAGVRFISIKNIRPFQPINWETYEKYISQDEHLALTKRCKPEFDDILFPRIGTLGFAKRIDFVEEVSIFVGLGLLKPNKALVRPKYLEYWMNHPLIVRLSRERATGSGRLTLPLEQSREFPVPVPPLTRQDEIFAEIEKQFSRLDQAVANLKRVKANLKHYKAAVLKAAFEGRLVPTEAELARREDRDYDGGGQLLEQIRSLPPAMSKRKASPAESTSAGDELPTLPPGWVWARLDAIAELTGGITVDKKRKDATAREVPYLRVANVQRGYLDLSEVKTIRASEADISSLALRTGDILFNEGGDRDKLGRGWVWEGQIGECIHQNHVFRARPLLDALSPKFISWWGNTFGKDYFLREGKQTTNLASISLTKLSRFPVPIPPASEQARITAEAARLLSIIDGLESRFGGQHGESLKLKDRSTF